MITYSDTKDFNESQLAGLFSSVGWKSAQFPERLVKAVKGSDTVLSAWNGEKLVGLINAIDDGEMTAYVHYLLVDPDCQHLGIGSQLVSRIKEIYKNYVYIILIAENEKLISFYNKLGFSVEQDASPMAIIDFQDSKDIK